MKILKENTKKESSIPLDFITSFISRGWDEVGILKASIEGLKKEYANTEQLESILLDWLDSYLITLGQLEALTSDQKLIDYPEDFQSLVLDSEEKSSDEKEASDYNSNIKDVEVKKSAEENTDKEDFDYIADFDDIDISTPPITDEELYGD